MKNIKFCIAAFVAFLTCACYAETQQEEKITVYRLELRSDAHGNETAYVVGVDGVSRPVVLVDPIEYKMLTERLDAMWQSFHATSDGRRKLHGKIERTEIDEKARKKVEIYYDGFRYTETIPEKRKPNDGKKTIIRRNGEEHKPKWMPDMQWEMRQSFKRHRQAVAKQLTIEHDEVTGKDTVQEGK